MNKHRCVLDLSGVWKFRPDPDDTGEREGWYKKLEKTVDIAVPGSWNEQLEELGLLHYVGGAWFETEITIPLALSGKKFWLHVGSTDYTAKVWVNGSCVGNNEAGFLPFEFDVSSLVEAGKTARVTILADNRLTDESIPQGISARYYEEEKRLREETSPPARFDFTPFGGIHRPVKLYTTSSAAIRDIKVTTKILTGQRGIVDVQIKTTGAKGLLLSCTLRANGTELITQVPVSSEEATLSVDIDNCIYWSPSVPFLYNLDIELVKGVESIDGYSLPVGVREVRVEGTSLLLNGEPMYLTGFGKHEDFAILGKGLSLPIAVKDFTLMKWVNANSFRTSHYPYADEILELADRLGILVIDEVPAVSIDMRRVTPRTLENHKAFTARLIDRDYNHPSVIMWALGNEPNLVGEASYYNGSGRKYWEEVFAHARALDGSRPLVVPNCTRAGVNDPVLALSDVVCINRYYGWYEYPGRLDHAMSVLNDEMEQLHRLYPKPMMMTEFGADTIPGYHSTSDQLFTEEYQEKLLTKYIQLLRSKSYVIGEHVWNFADFRTPQHFRRVVLNRKGVFTREREPKLAAFKLKALWSERTEKDVRQSRSLESVIA
jgi:beta-glucuronidase